MLDPWASNKWMAHQGLEQRRSGQGRCRGSGLATRGHLASISVIIPIITDRRRGSASAFRLEPVLDPGHQLGFIDVVCRQALHREDCVID